MDASKLRNSCICGNTLPYLECCGRYADPPAGQAGADSAPARGPRPITLPHLAHGLPGSGEAELPRLGESRPAAPGRSRGQGKASAGRGAEVPKSTLPDSGTEIVPESARNRPLGSQGEDADSVLYYAFRHGLHELTMALFPLRALYQAYWEKLAKEDYPHDMLMEDPDYGRSIVENFFWDHFMQYSDARPILRTAREWEGKDLRLAHDLMQWSYAPLWIYRVLERNPKSARLANLGNGKIHTVFHSGRIPERGECVLTRILTFRGREYCGHAALTFASGHGETRVASAVTVASAEGPQTPDRVEALLRAGCRELGVKPSVTLRPDVHCEEWRRHGAVFLALWRAEHYDSVVGRPVRGSDAAQILILPLDNREDVFSAMASSRDARPVGSGMWDLRYRALRLGRLEIKGGNLSVTLADEAFRKHVKEWLRNRLGDRSAGSAGHNAEPGDTSGSEDLWLQAPMDALNGQTPIQACAHDWGRRRLQTLLKEMADRGRDVSPLRNRLGI